MRYLSLALIPFMSFFIFGCSTSDTPAETPTDDYIGMSTEDAQELAKTNNVAFRVTTADGEALPATMDYQPGRINATTEAGIVTEYSVEGQDETTTETVSYDANSWKTMIPDTCESFSDGCNTCNREAGSDIAACTRMFCQEYQEPTCLDNAE